MPRTRLVRETSPLAKRFGLYLSSAMACRTRSAVAGATRSGVLRTLLTVAVETLASRATSVMSEGRA